MKKLKIALVIESILLACAVFIIGIGLLFGGVDKRTEAFRETSPNGNYILTVAEIGSPAWPFGPMKYEVRLFPADNKIYEGSASFYTYVSDDGGKGSFAVKWESNQAVITFSGEEQSDSVFALPLK